MVLRDIFFISFPVPRKSVVRFLLVALALFVISNCVSSQAQAQDTPQSKAEPAAASKPSPTPIPESRKDNGGPVKIQTDLVTVTLTVQDLYGRYVSGLTKKAFSVTDNNVEQEIVFFSDADAPASIGIIFDVSGSMSGEKIEKSK